MSGSAGCPTLAEHVRHIRLVLRRRSSSRLRCSATLINRKRLATSPSTMLLLSSNPLLAKHLPFCYAIHSSMSKEQSMFEVDPADANEVCTEWIQIHVMLLI
jgi:hypothetical protein